MIKKFNEYIKELYPGTTSDIRELEIILPKDEIDDQFLRLKEVFECRIDWNYYICGEIRIGIFPKRMFNDDKKFGLFQSKRNFNKYLKEISNEVITIKNRMEKMFPVNLIVEGYIISRKINYETPSNNWIGITIRLSRNKPPHKISSL